MISRAHPRRPMAALIGVLAALVAACGPGAPDSGDPDDPNASRAADARRLKLEEKRDREIKRVGQLGYLGAYRPAEDHKGVTWYDRERAHPGYNLYVSGEQIGAWLIDMEGRLIHEWSYPFEESFPGKSVDDVEEANRHWRRTALQPDGSMIVLVADLGLIKIDRDSKLLWGTLNGSHHDLDVAPDGSIYTLTKQFNRIERYGDQNPVLVDFVDVLSPGGEFVRRISIDEAYARSSFSAPTRRTYGVRPGIYHTNTITVLDGRHAELSAAFAAGNLLICPRNYNHVAVLDPATATIVWDTGGPWKHPHEPKLLENGRLLIFDNRGGGKPGAPASRILELDPLSLEIFWKYEGTPEQPFFSNIIGVCDRLPNGNTLITESTGGRVFEVIREGERVWEFYNPHRGGQRDDLIATVPEMIRIDPAYLASWLPPRNPAGPQPPPRS